MFPGAQQRDFEIEKSIMTVAITELTALEFTKDQLLRMYQENTQLNRQVPEWNALYINLLIYELDHQEYNDLLLKICNLLYLTARNKSCGNEPRIVPLTQKNIVDVIGNNSVRAAKTLPLCEQKSTL